MLFNTGMNILLEKYRLLNFMLANENPGWAVAESLISVFINTEHTASREAQSWSQRLARIQAVCINLHQHICFCSWAAIRFLQNTRQRWVECHFYCLCRPQSRRVGLVSCLPRQGNRSGCLPTSCMSLIRDAWQLGLLDHLLNPGDSVVCEGLLEKYIPAFQHVQFYGLPEEGLLQISYFFSAATWKATLGLR